MKTHRTDGLSLTFGLIFLAITAWWLLAQVVDVSLPNLGWFVAGALILLGVLGLIGALRGNGHHGPEQASSAAADAPPVTRSDDDTMENFSEGGAGEPGGTEGARPAG